MSEVFPMMRHKSLPLFLSVISLALFGCSGSSDTTPNGSGGSATGGSANSGAGTNQAGTGTSGGSGNSCSANFSATVASNYQFTSTITLTPIAVKPDSELTFDWSAVTKDFLDHAMDPAKDVDFANLLLWSLSEEELQTKLNADDLPTKYLVVPAKLPTSQKATSAGLFDFQAASGQPLSKEEILPYMSATTYPPATNTYTFILSTGDVTAGGRSRMIQSMKLDPASTNTKITLTNDSTKLEYEADLHSLTPTVVPASTADLKISWEDILKNAMGNTFQPTQITEVRVAHYTQTAAELEQKFLDLELIAENTWRNTDLAGTDASLSTLKDDAGQAFPGVSASGTWMLGLVCGACRNPAPWYLTVLKPCQ